MSATGVALTVAGRGAGAGTPAVSGNAATSSGNATAVLWLGAAALGVGGSTRKVRRGTERGDGSLNIRITSRGQHLLPCAMMIRKQMISAGLFLESHPIKIVADSINGNLAECKQILQAHEPVRWIHRNISNAFFKPDGAPARLGVTKVSTQRHNTSRHPRQPVGPALHEAPWPPG